MTFVTTSKLYCEVVLNDVMHPGARCGHSNIQIENLETSCHIWQPCVRIDNSCTVYLVMYCMFYITSVAFKSMYSCMFLYMTFQYCTYAMSHNHTGDSDPAYLDYTMDSFDKLITVFRSKI